MRLYLRLFTAPILALGLLGVLGCTPSQFRRPAYSPRKVEDIVGDYRRLALHPEDSTLGPGLIRAADRILQKWRPSEEEKRQVMESLSAEAVALEKSGEPVAAGRMRLFYDVALRYVGAPAFPRRDWEPRR